jgi:predicted small lipoprotein YifL
MTRLLILAALLALAACGKVGPNAPPGPASDVITSKLSYPAE